MRAVEQEQIKAGACLDLPLEVVDKYFMADPHTERFQYLTAKAICGRCAVQATCLSDAIRSSAASGVVRGGESGSALDDLHRRYKNGEDIDLLTIESLRKQRPLRGNKGADTLRAGQFEDAELLRASVVNFTVPETGQVE